MVFPQALQCLVEMFVIALLLLALHTVICPDPGLSRIVIDSQVASGLCNRLIRLDGQFDRTLLECGGILLRR